MKYIEGPNPRLVFSYVTAIKIRAINKNRTAHLMAGFSEALQGTACLNPTICCYKIQGINEKLISFEVWTVLAIVGTCLMAWQVWTEGLRSLLWFLFQEVSGLLVAQSRHFFPLPSSEVTGASVKVHGKGAHSSKKRELIKCWEEYNKSCLFFWLLREPAKMVA